MYKLLVVINVFIAACSQMLLKKSANNNYVSFVKQYVNPWVICGYLLLAVTMVVNVFAMSRGVLAKEVCVIETLSFLFVPLLSYVIFKEEVTIKKIGSIVLIVLGIIIFFT